MDQNDNNQDFTESFFQMTFLKEEGLFELAWFDTAEEGTEKKKYFSVRLLPETFQRMSYDMLRMVKDYNLMQAQAFQEKENERGIGNGGECSGCCPSCLNLEDGNAQGVAAEGSCEKPAEDHQGADGEAQGIPQEV